MQGLALGVAAAADERCTFCFTLGTGPITSCSINGVSEGEGDGELSGAGVGLGSEGGITFFLQPSSRAANNKTNPTTNAILRLN